MIKRQKNVKMRCSNVKSNNIQKTDTKHSSKSNTPIPPCKPSIPSSHPFLMYSKWK